MGLKKKTDKWETRQQCNEDLHRNEGSMERADEREDIDGSAVSSESESVKLQTEKVVREIRSVIRRALNNSITCLEKAMGHWYPSEETCRPRMLFLK